MKQCPACHKEVEDASTECRYCSVIFEKWIALHSGPPQSAPAAPAPDIAVKKPPVLLLIMISILVLAVAGQLLPKKPSLTPEQVLESYVKAIYAGDAEGFKVAMAEEPFKEVEKSGMPMPNVLKILTMSMPEKYIVKRVKIDGKTAVIDLASAAPTEIKEGGGPAMTYMIEGSINFTKEKGNWKISLIDTKMNMDMAEEYMLQMQQEAERNAQAPGDYNNSSQAPVQPMPARMQVTKPIQNVTKRASGSNSDAWLTPEDFAKMPEHEVYRNLRSNVWHTLTAARELEKRGLKHQAVNELNLMIRNKTVNKKSLAQDTLRALKEPVTFDWDNDDPPKEDGASVREWSVEMSGGRILCTGTAMLGDDLYAGLKRLPNNAGPISMPLFARAELEVKGGTLSQPLKKTLELNTQVYDWNNVELASNLGPGKYDVSIFIHVQSISKQGQYKIVNDSSFPLHVEN